MPTDPVDFSKIDPLIRDYILDLRETAKKSKAELKAVSLERDAYKEQLEEIKKAKVPGLTPDFRTLSPQDYRKALREMRQNALLTEYDKKLTRRVPSDVKDVKQISPEAYREWKLTVTGRKKWR